MCKFVGKDDVGFKRFMAVLVRYVNEIEEERIQVAASLEEHRRDGQ